jgi:hypothetical protein
MLRPLAFLTALLFCCPAFAQQPAAEAPEPQVMCTMEAKLCPDGSSVGRTGPHCEFAPCPGETGAPAPQPLPPAETAPGEPGESAPGGAPGYEGGSDDSSSIEDGYGIVKPGFASAIQPRALPDAPIDGRVDDPMTVQFLIEHRSALNGKEVSVHGIVVGALLGEAACPPDRGACAQPRLTLADTSVPYRDTGYDLTILLPGNDTTSYSIGQILDLSGIVSGSADGVMMRKN